MAAQHTLSLYARGVRFRADTDSLSIAAARDHAFVAAVVYVTLTPDSHRSKSRLHASCFKPSSLSRVLLPAPKLIERLVGKACLPLLPATDPVQIVGNDLGFIAADFAPVS